VYRYRPPSRPRLAPPDAATGKTPFSTICHAAPSTIFAATSIDFRRLPESIRGQLPTAALPLWPALTLLRFLPPVTFHISADPSLL
jgi:hypothetical protein